MLTKWKLQWKVVDAEKINCLRKRMIETINYRTKRVIYIVYATTTKVQTNSKRRNKQETATQYVLSHNSIKL